MLAIRGGYIIPVSGTPIEGGTILIDGDRITAVGIELAIPEGCPVLDAAGCTITPGLIDAHCHVGIEEEIYRIEGDDLNETSDPITPHLMAIDGINLRDLAFSDAAAAGITRLLVPPGSANILGGQAVVLKTWAPNLTDMIYRNPWGLKAALGENPKRVYGGQNKAPKTRMASAALLRESLFAAGRQVDKAENQEKNARETFRNEPLIKVLRREMPLLLHVHRADDILTALRIKDEFHIDLILQHATEGFLVADELAKRQVPVCLGPLLVNRAKVEMKEVTFKSAAALAAAGVDFCLITDHPVIPIQYLGITAALTVREGLDEAKAIEAVTLAPARILGMDLELGSIEPGKRADLAIFDGHPLEIKSRVRHVVVDGVLWGGVG
ncbi:MAG: amidohydrolase [Solirubrobacterales bacterium]